MSHYLPSLTSDAGLTRYLQEIKRFPMLSQDEEYMLAKRYQEHEDKDSAHKLVTSHLRLVAKIAGHYRGYGLPLADIIAEGNIGLMQAVKKFDPDKGFRLSTYAMWWIKASIQEFVLKSWSLVKVGTNAVQKRLFFNLRKLKNKILTADRQYLDAKEINTIAKTLDVSADDVVAMDQRMSGDYSLNAPLRTMEEDAGEWQDRLIDDRPSQETIAADTEENTQQKTAIQFAMQKLNEREQAIVKARHFQDEPATLEDLSQTYKISRERVRQIESRALEKLTTYAREAIPN